MKRFKTSTRIKQILFYCKILSLNIYALPPQHNNFNQKSVDEKLWDVSSKLADDGNFEKVITLNQKLIDESKNADYIKGVVKGYCNLGNVFCRMGKYKESLSFLQFAEKENKKLGDKEMESTIYSEYGNNYYLLRLYTQSLEYFKKSLALTNYISGRNRKGLRLFAYSNIISIYEIRKKPDSAFYYSKINFNELKDIYNSNTLAYHYLHYKKDLDSTEYYLKYADEISASTSEKSIFEDYSTSRNWGEFYEQKGDFKKAKIFYDKSLKFAKVLRLPFEIRDSYWLMHRISDSLKDEKVSNIYLKKYTQLYDSLSKVQNVEAEFPIQQYIKDKEQEYKDKEFRLYYIILLIVFFAVVFVYVLIRINKRKEKFLENKIQEKKEKIIEKEKETDHLKFKINEGFDEVIRLAKENNPEFVTLFREYYPEFSNALIHIYPEINNDTLKFCALLKLNFSTKDISEYTFVTPRAVQIRKNRLRKKMNISSDEDIYLWMNNLG